MMSEDVDYDGPLPPMPSMVVMPWEDKTDRLVFNDHRQQKRMVDEAVKDRVDFEYSPDTPEVEERNAKLLTQWMKERRTRRRNSFHTEPNSDRKRKSALDILRKRCDDLARLLPNTTRDVDTRDAIWYLAGLVNDGALSREQVHDAIIDASHANRHYPDNKSIDQIERDIERGLDKAAHGFDWHTTDGGEAGDKGKAETRTEVSDSENKDDEPTTWEPVDLGPVSAR
jgi:hypothetical protein